jgi:hypothetical protein
METIILALIVIGLVAALLLFSWAFGIAIRAGSWNAAMLPDRSTGKWPLARKLLVAGAAMGVFAFTMCEVGRQMFIP